MIKAVIFDMDGVIALSSDLQSAAESKVLAKRGINITPREIVRTYSGLKDTEFFEKVLNRYNVQVDIQQLRKEKWNIVYKELLPQGIPSIPGAKEFIELLKSNRYILALASTAPLKFVKTILETLGLSKTFSAITSGDEVKVGKPDPTIFLLTAKKLKVVPQECLVIEDAKTGVKAAKVAGMKSIAITTTTDRKELEEADKVIDFFDELIVGYIKNL